MIDLRPKFVYLSHLSKSDLTHFDVTVAIADLALESLSNLAELQKIELNSSIVGKDYFIFDNDGKYSRPINSDLFHEGIAIKNIENYKQFNWEIIGDNLQIVLYTLAMSYCAATDVLGKNDKKTPSVYFEYFIGNLFARTYNVEPISQISVEIDDIKTLLPTDYLFQPPQQFIKIHLPIKLSTRERSIQAWAHQRVLEGIHGVGRFRGVMVVMAETNFVSKSMSVVEVCLPEQWRLYQMYISQMSRIYYLDLPDKYAELPEKFPHIQVKPFSEFFKESALMISKGTV